MPIMMSNGLVAVVTGGNRGLGLETCRQLAEQGYRVVLTARDESAAARAASRLGVDYVQLDVADDANIERAANEIRDLFGQVDVLVNNAGIAMDGFDAEVAKTTIAVNTFGPMAVTDALRPLLSEQAVIVMVSSGMGELSCLSADRRSDFEDPSLSRERLEELMNAFVSDVEDGTYEANGWPGSAYRVSKVGLNAFTRIITRELADSPIRVNAVCPGWVRTDMGGANANRGLDEGGYSIVWAATLPSDGPSGGFFRDGEAIEW